MVSTSGYQCLAHMPSDSRMPGGHSSINSENLILKRLQSALNISLGFFSTSVESITGGVSADTTVLYSPASKGWWVFIGKYSRRLARRSNAQGVHSR